MDRHVDIAAYCGNPKAYIKTVPVETRKYYDSICNTRDKLTRNWKKELSRFGTNLAEAPEKMIENILSPQGLEMLGIFTGIDLTSKAALNGILRGIARGVSPNVMEIAAKQAAEEGALFINNAIIASVIGTAVEEGTVAAIAFSVTEAVSTAISSATSIAVIVQFLGMLLDMWDPLGYEQELNADAMEVINSEFDIAFANKFLSLLTIGRDRFGRPIHFGQLPVEYRVDAELVDNDLDYQKKLYQYTFEYLDSLEYNSDGHAMRPRKKGGTLVTDGVFTDFAESLGFALSDQNTEVFRWTRTHLVLTALVVAVLLYLLFVKKW